MTARPFKFSGIIKPWKSSIGAVRIVTDSFHAILIARSVWKSARESKFVTLGNDNSVANVSRKKNGEIRAYY